MLVAPTERMVVPRFRRGPEPSEAAAEDEPGRLTLEAVQRATRTSVVERFVRELCEGTGWAPVSVRRRGVRLDPPVAYWASYRVRLQRERKGSREPDERRLLLVARACFAAQDWAVLREQLLEDSGGQPCDPLTGIGWPVLFDRTQHAFWFYPYDPALPTLAAADDPRRLRPLLAPRYSAKTPPARIGVDVVRYVPESSAALRYTVRGRPGTAERTVYGKLYRGRGGLALHETMQELAALARTRPELLSVVEPMAYDEELALHLEHAAPGEPVPPDRTDPRFQAAALAAADALVALHDARLAVGGVLELGPEVDRLDDVAAQLALVHPPGEQLMRSLVTQIRRALARLPAEEQVVTHGDMKYDQFLELDGRFTLVDFEEVGLAETSWDLGKWCAHAVPSKPETWEQSDGAERARAAFLQRYRGQRPDVSLVRFPVYEAVHLANRAMVLMWGQSTDWESAAESLLALAADRLSQPAP